MERMLHSLATLLRNKVAVPLGTAMMAATALTLYSLLGGRDRLTRARWWLRQRWLRLHLVQHDLIDWRSARYIGGVDISFVKGSATDACAALVVVDAADALAVVHATCRRIELRQPYVPGYLAFREVDFLLELLDSLRSSSPHLLPDVILVDGNGILHPNRFGLACHLGVLSGIPTVGVGKSLHHVDGLSNATVKGLCQEGGPLQRCGDHAELIGQSGRCWGALLRTTNPVEGSFKPIVISVGHALGLPSAVNLVNRCTLHRIPEPVRQADVRSRQWLREHGALH